MTPPRKTFLNRQHPPHIATLIVMAGIPALNMSIFLPSLNQMAQDFDTSYAIMQLSVSAYLAVTALVQVAVGPLSDRFGRRPVVLSAMMVFILATLGCLFAPNVTVFLICRMLQAAVATGMVLARAIVRDMVPQEKAASMIGYVTMGMSLVPMFGPMIGGALDQWQGWHATFVFLAFAGAIVLTLCWVDQGETVAGGGVSFRDQLRGYPELLTSPRFWGYVLCAAFSSGAFFALLGGASYVAEDVYHLSAFWAGFALGAPAVGYLIGNWASGRFAVQVGINPMIFWGTVVTLGGLGLSLLLGLIGFRAPGVFFGFCTFLGLGNGLVLPSTMAGMLSVRPHLAGTASGLGGAIMIGGGAALSALAGAILTGAKTALPLQTIMFLSTLGALLAIFAVIRRERRIAP